MFEEVLGIPAHPLLVHAAVVFVPLQVLAAFVYALVPVVRRLIAWLVVGLAVLAPITAFMAKLAGDALRERMIRNATVTPEFLPKIDQHSSFGNSTLYASLILSVLTVGLVVVQVLRSRPRRDPDHATSGDDKATTNGATTNGAKGMMLLAVVLTVAVLSVGGATGYYVFKTGDSGAHMVWDGL